MRTQSGQADGVTPGPAQAAGDSSNVIPFRPRDGRHSPSQDAPADVADGLAKYERSGGEDDYRHRMTMNVVTLVFTILLATAGAWLAVTIGDMRKNQDCYLSGRRNCTPIDVQSLQNR
jgi:hypothetical protein